MAKNLTSIHINFNDDGTIHWSAGDKDAEGHLWAFEQMPLTWAQMRTIGDTLGIRASVALTLDRIIERQRKEAERLDFVVARATAAKTRLQELEELRGAVQD